MESTNIKSSPVQWRMLALGSTVWAPFGDHGWRPGIVIGLGKNRGDRTIVHLAFETGGKGRRVAGELYWRKAEMKGKDKPKLQTPDGAVIETAAQVDARLLAEVQARMVERN